MRIKWFNLKANSSRTARKCCQNQMHMHSSRQNVLTRLSIIITI